MATIKDVAKEAGLSISTVSKVLNNRGYVSVESRKKVMEAVKKLDYQVNAAARSLKSSKSNKVGVIVSDISNYYMMSLAKAIEDTISPLGYHLLVMSHNEDSQIEEKLLQIIIEQRVDGLVLVPTGKNGGMIQTVLNKGIPTVLVDRKVDDIHTDLIVDDNYYGSYEAIRYLKSLGHERIGIIYGTMTTSLGQERFQGAVDALKSFNCSLDQSLLVSGSFTQEGAYKAAKELFFLPQRPTAIYCLNNTMTKGLMKACFEQKIDIPDELSIIAYGDLEQWELVRPPLTMITQPLKRVGLEAALILKNRLTSGQSKYDPIQRMIKPELAIRSSCVRKNT